MGSSFKALYLSPHLDDVVLSCGGQIRRRTREDGSVLVVTVFAADEPPGPYSGFVEKLHKGFGLNGGIVAERRSEDQEACSILGAQALHLDETEASYRLHPQRLRPLYPKYRYLFRRPKRQDRDLVSHLAQRLASLPHAEEIVVPLGVGRHVDHILVRQAAEKRFGMGSLSYYDDFPYVELWPWARFRAARPRRLWSSSVETLSEEDLLARVEAIAAYRSQLPLLFGDVHEAERRVRSHVNRTGGERLWRRRAS